MAAWLGAIRKREEGIRPNPSSAVEQEEGIGCFARNAIYASIYSVHTAELPIAVCAGFGYVLLWTFLGQDTFANVCRSGIYDI